MTALTKRIACAGSSGATKSPLGNCYAAGTGVAKDYVEAVRWYRKAAESGDPKAQFNVAVCYSEGNGVDKDAVEAVKWITKAAIQDFPNAQCALGYDYTLGDGVLVNYADAYKWFALASVQGYMPAKKGLSTITPLMTKEQVAEAQRLSRDFKPQKILQPGVPILGADILDSGAVASGTGFFITEDGFLITNEHVVRDSTQIRLVTSIGFITAKVVKTDADDDIALLKAEGKFPFLPIKSSHDVRLGNAVLTIGFPNIGLQGFSPKFAKGEIASLAGAQDNPRYFQISIPVQPGNSGGGLVDSRGNVVGIVSSKLNAATTLAASGALPENVNYAVKSSFLLSFLESVPDVSVKVRGSTVKALGFEDAVKSAEQAAALIVVY